MMCLHRALSPTFPAGEMVFFIPWRGGAEDAGAAHLDRLGPSGWFSGCWPHDGEVAGGHFPLILQCRQRSGQRHIATFGDICRHRNRLPLRVGKFKLPFVFQSPPCLLPVFHCYLLLFAIGEINESAISP
jgi:hypothetical protein